MKKGTTLRRPVATGSRDRVDLPSLLFSRKEKSAARRGERVGLALSLSLFVGLFKDGREEKKTEHNGPSDESHLTSNPPNGEETEYHQS